MDGFRERMVRDRDRFIEDYDDNVDQARLDLGKLFRIKDYPSKDALRPSKSFATIARARVKRDADELMEKFAGYFAAPVEPARETA